MQITSGNNLSEVIFMDRIGRKVKRTERKISDVYPVIDTDLARDNVENHIPQADLQDLQVEEKHD